MVIVALTFLLVLGIVLGAYFAFIVRPESGERSKLLRRLGKTKSAGDGKSAQLERPADRLSDIRAVQAVLGRAKGISGPLDSLLTQSGLKMTVGTLLTASAF